MNIEHIGNHYVATGKGLQGVGKTRHQAIINLLREIREMKAFYKSLSLVLN